MRPSRDETMMTLAYAIAERSTCARRKVGAVAVSSLGRVLSMGHNGVATGEVHCTDQPCAGADLPSGTGLAECRAIHAESNMLLFCPDVMQIDTMYSTTAPCDLCVRLLLNTSCRRIVYAEEYDQAALDRWMSLPGRQVRRIR
jgi:dCMP deaminase